MATMREWNMRSRSCWAIAALAISAVALGVTAGQVSAFAQKRTPTGRVSLAEWKHWDNEVTRLNASFNADRNLLGPSEAAECNALKSGNMPASYETAFTTPMRGFAKAATEDATGGAIPLALWGQGLARRSPSYRAVSSTIYKGATEMFGALTDLHLAFAQLGNLICDQTANVFKANSEWLDGYSDRVLPGLNALKKTIH
ncbi:MAG: hypothetical protein ABSB24_13485 [Gaiellaceae bacterium]|jgi:hypothetical protein